MRHAVNRTPTETVEAVLRCIAAQGDDHVWISRVDDDALRARALALEDARRRSAADQLPLYGVPFAVKDNIDVAGLPTTAACPDFAYMPDRSAVSVQRLEAAGAILIGKTNLDQFATGLVGVRSPYGVARNPFDPAYIPGGSSSGSAVAVATGQVAFALGTDTAGSGRVPAGFNNIVGVKPTIGLVAATGVVPACRSLDCVSVFANSVADGVTALGTLAGPDTEDPFSREAPEGWTAAIGAASGSFAFAVPSAPAFFGDGEYARLFGDAVARMESLGGRTHEIDFAPFGDAAEILYSPAGVAERVAAVGDFLSQHPASVLPATRQIIERGRNASAADVYRARERLAALRAAAMAEWGDADFLLVPTAPTTYRIAEVESDPVTLNSRLGTYTNFVNPMDLCAIAVPSGFTGRGLPFGVTLIGRAFAESRVAAFASAFEAATALPPGAIPRERKLP